MTPAIRPPRGTPWATAAAVYAWCTAAVLTVLIELGTLLLVAPPALVASAPLLVPLRHRPVASLVAAVLLAVWGVLGIALLGLYFLPSAALLTVAYISSRRRQDPTSEATASRPDRGRSGR